MNNIFYLGLLNKNQNNGPAISTIVDAISIVKDIRNKLNDNNLSDNLIKNITSILNNNGIDLRNLLNNLKVDPNQPNQIKKGLFNLFDINKGKK